MQIIVKFRVEKILCTFLPPSILLRGMMKYQLQKQLCSFENERLISFSYTIWLMIPEKKKKSQGAYFFTMVHACNQKSQQGIHKIFSFLKLSLCGLAVFIDMNTYILTEGSRSFKIFLTENYTFALDSCYLFT